MFHVKPGHWSGILPQGTHDGTEPTGHWSNCQAQSICLGRHTQAPLFTLQTTLFYLQSRSEGERQLRNMPQQLQQTVAVFKGHVQGVGFRYTVQRISRQFPVTGYVRNLDDGSVELLAEGEPTIIEQFIDTISLDMGRYIREVHVEIHVHTGSFSGFTVAF